MSLLALCIRLLIAILLGGLFLSLWQIKEYRKRYSWETAFRLLRHDWVELGRDITHFFLRRRAFALWHLCKIRFQLGLIRDEFDSALDYKVEIDLYLNEEERGRYHKDFLWWRKVLHRHRPIER